MKRAILIALVAGAAVACGSTVREYANNDLELAANHTAHDICTCLFVMQMPEDYCQEYTRASPDIARYSVDREKKVVEASAIVLWGARARYQGPSFGCTLVDD